MIICSRCNAENQEGSKFCCQCGNDLTVNVDVPASDELKKLADALNEQAVHTKKQPFNLNKAIADIPKNIWNGIRNSIFFRKKKNTILTFSSMLLVAVLIFGILNSGYIAFTATYLTGKYELAQSIQAWSFNSDRVRANIQEFVIEKMDDCYDEYYAEEISYEEAQRRFDVAKKFTGNKDARKKADKLHNSRMAYEKAEKYAKKGDTYRAVIEYLKVIAEDKNYNSAKEKIGKNKPVVKKKAISQMDECIEAKDFETGLKIVSDMEKIFSDDSDINKYKKDFEDLKEAHRIQELKDNQKVKIINAYAYDDGYYTIIRKASIIWQNNSDKVIKEAEFVILQYDDYGYPVDAEYNMYKYNSIDNSYRCSATSANVAPGASYGNGYYWYIADKATNIKACVKSVKFMDGSTWTNPYLEYWLEEFES